MLYVGSLNYYCAFETGMNVQVVLDCFRYCIFYILCFSSRLATKCEIVINMSTSCTRLFSLLYILYSLFFLPFSDEM